MMTTVKIYDKSNNLVATYYNVRVVSQGERYITFNHIDSNGDRVMSRWVYDEILHFDQIDSNDSNNVKQILMD